METDPDPGLFPIDRYRSMKIPDSSALKASSVPSKKKPLYRSLFFQILIAVVAGVLIGHFWPDLGAQLRPLGDGFIQLIKMIIAPLIFLVIVTGISAVGDVKAVGRVGVKALLYFTAATLFALVFGLIVGNIVQPGAGLNIDPSTLSQEAVDAKTGHAVPKDAAAFILDVIPTSVIGAFANNSLLQVLFFSVFFGAFLWGIPGAFIGVPIAIALLTICEQYPSSEWIARLLGGSPKG